MHDWFDLQDKIGLPLDTLLGLDYVHSGYYENRLFNAASAAEGFHAALFPDSTGLPPEAHSSLVRQVERALFYFLKADRNWGLSRIKDNRLGLKDRLVELVTKADDEAVQSLVTNVDTWAKWLKNARNAIGHLNTGELERKVPLEEARFRLEYITRAVLHLIILAELGMSGGDQRQVRARAQIGQDLGGTASALVSLSNWFTGQAQGHQLVEARGVEVLQRHRAEVIDDRLEGCAVPVEGVRSHAAAVEPLGQKGAQCAVRRCTGAGRQIERRTPWSYLGRGQTEPVQRRVQVFTYLAAGLQMVGAAVLESDAAAVQGDFEGDPAGAAIAAGENSSVVAEQARRIAMRGNGFAEAVIDVTGLKDG